MGSEHTEHFRDLGDEGWSGGMWASCSDQQKWRQRTYIWMVKLWVLRGKGWLGIFSRRILSFGASSRLLLGVWRPKEDQLSSEHVKLCLDPKDGGVECVKGSLKSGKGSYVGIKMVL